MSLRFGIPVVALGMLLLAGCADQGNKPGDKKTPGEKTPPASAEKASQDAEGNASRNANGSNAQQNQKGSDPGTQDRESNASRNANGSNAQQNQNGSDPEKADAVTDDKVPTPENNPDVEKADDSSSKN